MKKGLGSIFSLFCALTGCSGSPRASGDAGATGHEEGSAIQLNLSTTAASGTEYRLGPATFDIFRYGQPFTTVTSSGSEQTLHVALEPDSYSVKLEPGWTLSRVDGQTLTPVAATLTSYPEQYAPVKRFETLPITYAFHLGESGIDIGVSVDEGVPPGYDAAFVSTSTPGQYALEWPDGGQYCCFATLAEAQASFPSARIYAPSP